MYYEVSGNGLPVVVLEAGIAASSVSWELVRRELAQSTTVFTYDRAGLGRSPLARHRSTALDAARDLRCVLAKAGVPGPYIVVGHSFGGLIVRVFQQYYPKLVSGIVLLDPVARSEWAVPTPDRARMLGRGVMLSRRGATLARLGVVGLALKLLTGGNQRVPKLLAKLSAGRGAGITDRLVGEVKKLPRELWPVVAEQWSQPKSFTAMANSLESLPVSASQLDESRGLSDLPLVVLSSDRSTPAALREHAADAALSSRGRHIVLSNTGHWLQLDAPEAVCMAVRDVCRG